MIDIGLWGIGIVLLALAILLIIITAVNRLQVKNLNSMENYGKSNTPAPAGSQKQKIYNKIFKKISKRHLK